MNAGIKKNKKKILILEDSMVASIRKWIKANEKTSIKGKSVFFFNAVLANNQYNNCVNSSLELPVMVATAGASSVSCEEVPQQVALFSI